MSFKSQFFANNRRRLYQLAKVDLVIVAGNGLVQSLADQTYPFKQNSNFWYLTGLSEPDLIVVMAGSEEFLIAPERDSVRVIFEGDVDKAKLSQISGIKKVLNEKDGWAQLAKLAKKSRRAGALMTPPGYIKQAGFYINPAPARALRRLRPLNKNLKLIDVRDDLAQMRTIKQPAEIAAIQKAVDITVEAIDQALAKRQKFEFERQLKLAINNAFVELGADARAFGTIVAAGKNACTLHYDSGAGRLKEGELVLVDAGAEVSHYAGDLTRTVAMGTPTARQQAIFEAVLDVQGFALTQLKPGVLLKNYDQSVRLKMAENLVKLKLIADSKDEKIDHYFPHGLSHFLGLDVHDGRGWDKPLEAGMVLTVEPGIYIPQEAVGIRIEDDVLITDSGNRVLSSALPKNLI